ncbi:uncharacterized protein LOC103746667 [Nannospalax galili]|uniref:uncharacterized protein LOC103746667 n=1 Tax=Nannospalax galili TaxID=1026970 RepID=UPI0004ED452C|nr:uncharacterized protein LOC103746667 [Nannospalax galili]
MSQLHLLLPTEGTGNIAGQGAVTVSTASKPGRGSVAEPLHIKLKPQARSLGSRVGGDTEAGRAHSGSSPQTAARKEARAEEGQRGAPEFPRLTCGEGTSSSLILRRAAWPGRRRGFASSSLPAAHPAFPGSRRRDVRTPGTSRGSSTPRLAPGARRGGGGKSGEGPPASRGLQRAWPGAGAARGLTLPPRPRDPSGGARSAALAAGGDPQPRRPRISQPRHLLPPAPVDAERIPGLKRGEQSWGTPHPAPQPVPEHAAPEFQHR